uniref:ankyrin repeat domain-containing protein 26-like isoform X2 n=1 Tax=Ictidomys tridecemlineatus TaxID=43179 RepID=UPI001AA00206|nr:ankyrin repeat domain-containing protein 26-like isoform X2 [Ictidomys tridecemlineatus]
MPGCPGSSFAESQGPDSVSLLKICDAVHSFKRLIKLKKNHCKLLKAKILKVENKVTGLQKELSETKEVKSHLEHEKVEQEQELCNLRFTLKQEQEKRKNTDWLYEKIEEQLREKQEQYNKEVEVKQQLKISLRTLDMELKTVRKNLNQVLEERNDIQRQLSQKENVRILQDGILCKQKEIETTQEKMSSELQEAQNQHTEAVRCAEKMKDRLQKLELKNSKLKVIIKKQAEKNEQLQKNLFSANLELLSMKSIQKEYEKLEKNKKKLEQKVERLKSHIEKNMIKHDQVKQYEKEVQKRARQDLEEKLEQINLFLQTQAESQHLQQIRENNSASIKGQMELRIKHLESELFKMRTQEDSNRKQLGIYQEICLEGFQITKSLSDELDKTNEKLKEVNTKLLIEKHYNRSLQHSTLSTRPVSECHCTVNHDCFVFDRSFTPRRNLVAPTSNPWPSNESMQNPRVWQELQENITREVTEEALIGTGLYNLFFPNQTSI